MKICVQFSLDIYLPKITKGHAICHHEKTEHSILPKIQKWQTFHLKLNYFILFYETFAFGSN